LVAILEPHVRAGIRPSEIEALNGFPEPVLDVRIFQVCIQDRSHLERFLSIFLSLVKQPTCRYGHPT
jgi:hypothetical protein